MRKLCFIFGVIAAVPIVVAGVLFAYTLSFIIVTILPAPCIIPTGYHLARMHWIIGRGEMDWGEEVERSFDHLKQCKPDKRRLARALLSDEDGTIVSLGMDLVVQGSWDDGDQLLSRYRNDKRWNFYMTNNDEYSRLLLAMWKMKRGAPLSEEDTKVMARWSDKAIL